MFLKKGLARPPAKQRVWCGLGAVPFVVSLGEAVRHVRYLGYSALTRATRVRVPVAEFCIAMQVTVSAGPRGFPGKQRFLTISYYAG